MSCLKLTDFVIMMSSAFAETGKASAYKIRYHHGMECNAPNRIRELRIACKMTQERLAELCGTTNAQISRLESAGVQLTPAWMQKLSKALNCAPAELLPLSAFPRKEAELLSRYRSMTPAEQDQLIRLAVALAPPPAPSELSSPKAA